MELINSKALEAAVRARLAKGLEESLEPVIKKAVEEAEKIIRRQVGVFAIQTLNQSYEVFSDTNRLVITVNHIKGDES